MRTHSNDERTLEERKYFMAKGKQPKKEEKKKPQADKKKKEKKTYS
jgi:hypothetical protein